MVLSLSGSGAFLLLDAVGVRTSARGRGSRRVRFHPAAAPRGIDYRTIAPLWSDDPLSWHGAYLARGRWNPREDFCCVLASAMSGVYLGWIERDRRMTAAGSLVLGQWRCRRVSFLSRSGACPAR